MKEKLNSLFSRWVLTSAGNGDVLDGEPGEGSPFSNTLIKILIENTKENFSFSELCVLVRDKFPVNSVEQTPTYGTLLNLLPVETHAGGDFLFQLRDKSQTDSNQMSVETKDEKDFAILTEKSIEALKKEVFDTLKSYTTSLTEEVQALRRELVKKEAPHQNREVLINLLKQDKVDEFFLQITNILNESESDDLILLESQWRAIDNKAKIIGLNQEYEFQEKSRVRTALLKIVRDM